MNLVLVPASMDYGGAKRVADVLSERLGFKVWRVAPDRIGHRLSFVFNSGTDKVTQYRRFDEARIPAPDWTQDRERAGEWLGAGRSVVVRTLLRGYDGHGVSVVAPGEALPPAAVYSRYIPKQHEFRVNVLKGDALQILERRRRNGSRGDERIRNSDNGYVFCRDGFVEPEGIRALAISATEAVGYNFGGVDIIQTEEGLKVLEVNSAPELGPISAEIVATKIEQLYREKLNAML
jgi:glutathione synthase/RimK-type ligase-like ATP-grasp enzyme